MGEARRGKERGRLPEIYPRRRQRAVLERTRRRPPKNTSGFGVYKVTGGYTYELVYTASGRKVRTQLGADCTPAEKVEIEYLFDFYKRLWEKEKDAFLAAYIQKHRIFAIRADVEPREMSLEESIKMSALMRGMSDESPLRAIEAGK